jgi:hypothetical protein
VHGLFAEVLRRQSGRRVSSERIPAKKAYLLWPAHIPQKLITFPSEQPNDFPLFPTAEAFYRSGSTFWRRYTSFWLLLNQIVFFVIPVVATMVTVIGFAPPLLEMAAQS